MNPQLAVAITTAALELANKVIQAVFERKSAAEIARIALEEATKIENIQRSYDVRASQKFPGFRP